MQHTLIQHILYTTHISKISVTDLMLHVNFKSHSNLICGKNICTLIYYDLGKTFVQFHLKISKRERERTYTNKKEEETFCADKNRETKSERNKLMCRKALETNLSANLLKLTT